MKGFPGELDFLQPHRGILLRMEVRVCFSVTGKPETGGDTATSDTTDVAPFLMFLEQDVLLVQNSFVPYTP